MGKKDEILELIRNSHDQHVSGEDMAKNFGITRTAIWKIVNKLRRMGYNIRAEKRIGYRLTGVPDLLYPAEVQKNLETKILGRTVLYYPEINSTQMEAKKQVCHKNLPEGSLVVTEKQTDGVGRLGRRWESPRGGLWFSFVLRPKMMPEEVIKITLLVALAVARVIQKSFGIEVMIKWPNDVVVNGSGSIRKIGGILTEMGAELGFVNWVVVGVGINVNNNLPAQVKKTAVSIKKLLGKNVSRIKLLKGILKEIDAGYELLKRDGFQELLQELKRRSIVLGKRVEIRAPDEMITGQAIDLDRDGALIVRTDSKTRKIIAGEILKVNQL